MALEYGWDYRIVQKEIDIQSVDGNAKTYVNEYVKYLKGITNDENIIGDLLSIRQLVPLGCIIPSDYSYDNTDIDSRTCVNSPYSSWLLNGQSWWSKSAVLDNSTNAWVIRSAGTLHSNNCIKVSFGIRPVITISKETLKKS